MAMQATVRAKGHKPSRSGLLTVLLVFAVGLAIGALAWNVFEDDDTGNSSQAVVQAPSGGMDGHSEGLDNKYAEFIVAGQDTRPASNVEPGEPNLMELDYGIGVTGDTFAPPREQYRLYNGEASDGVITAHYAEGAGQGYVGGFTEFEPDVVTAYHSDGAGNGILGGFSELEEELPTAHYEEGMGEGWIENGTGTSVDAGIAQDPVALPGIGYFA